MARCQARRSGAVKRKHRNLDVPAARRDLFVLYGEPGGVLCCAQ